MSLFSHLRRHKSDKSLNSSRSTSVEPPRSVPRIIKTTDAPSIVSRDIFNPQTLSNIQEHSDNSNFSAESDSTIAEERQNNRRSTFDRARAIMGRSVSPSPSILPPRSEKRQTAPRGNHIVTDAVASFRPKLEEELKESKETELAAGVSSERLFGFIANERLRIMPARGSRWDKILRWAEDFAKKLSLFEVTDDSFIPSSKEAVDLILACIQLLLTVSCFSHPKLRGRLS